MVWVKSVTNSTLVSCKSDLCCHFALFEVILLIYHITVVLTLSYFLFQPQGRSGEEWQDGDESKNGEEHHDGRWEERGEVLRSSFLVSINTHRMVKYEYACWYGNKYGDDDSIDIHNILNHSVLEVTDVRAILLYLHLNDEKYAMPEDTSHHKEGYPSWWRLGGEKGQDFLASISQGKGAFGHHRKVPQPHLEDTSCMVNSFKGMFNYMGQLLALAEGFGRRFLFSLKNKKGFLMLFMGFKCFFCVLRSS